MSLLTDPVFVRHDAQAVIVSDLRVLAIEAQPAGFLVDPRVLMVDDDDPLLVESPAIDLSARFDVVDPRGGAIEATVRLCAGEDTLNSAFFVPPGFDPSGFDDAPRGDPEIIRACQEIDFTRAPFDDDGVRAAMVPRHRRVFAAPSDDDPFGPLDPPLVERFVITSRVIRALSTLVPGRLRDFNGANLWIVVEVSRAFEGEVESETAYLPLELRVDPTDPRLDNDERDRVLASVGRPHECAPELIAACRLEGEKGCGNGIIQEGETCEPPAGNRACVGNDAATQVCSFVVECLHDCQPAPFECNQIGQCLWPVVGNAPLALDGIDAFDPEVRIQDGIAVALHEAPTALGGVIRVPVTLGAARLAAAYDSSGLDFVQARSLDWQVNSLMSTPEDGGVIEDDTQTLRERLATFLEVPRLHVWVLGDTATLERGSGDPVESQSNGVGPLTFRPSAARGPGDRDVVRIAFSDGRGAWSSGTLTIEWE